MPHDMQESVVGGVEVAAQNPALFRADKRPLNAVELSLRAPNGPVPSVNVFWRR